MSEGRRACPDCGSIASGADGFGTHYCPNRTYPAPTLSEGKTVDRAADEPSDFLEWLETAQTFMSEQEKYEAAVQYGRDCEVEIAAKEARLQEYEAALQWLLQACADSDDPYTETPGLISTRDIRKALAVCDATRSP